MATYCCAHRGAPNTHPENTVPSFLEAISLGVDMIEFAQDVPFHQALKTAFEHFACEGWGIVPTHVPNPLITSAVKETWLDADTLDVLSTIRTPHGELTAGSRLSREEPSWATKRPMVDLTQDLPAWETLVFGGTPEDMDVSNLVKAWDEVGDSYLLEAWLGVPFFDTFAGGREGGFETGIFDFLDPELESTLERLREMHTERLVRLTRVICERTPLESLCIGCSWSCNSLLGPDLWRRWDKPGIQAVAEEVHRHGRLLHIHFHGRCMDTIADFAEIGVDCVCPFERPPGGDVGGLEGLREVARRLGGRTTMNGNVHTVETLIRGTPTDVRREVDEILEAFADTPRVIVGTGDQVGRETPEENLVAMVEQVKRQARPTA